MKDKPVVVRIKESTRNRLHIKRTQVKPSPITLMELVDRLSKLEVPKVD
jgi:hypothetical protein